jgi:hypothetical protein
MALKPDGDYLLPGNSAGSLSLRPDGSAIGGTQAGRNSPDNPKYDSDHRGTLKTVDQLVRGKQQDAPPVAGWYFRGKQVKGETRAEYRQVMSAAQDRAAEAIQDNRIPRKYADVVGKYFDEYRDDDDD